MAEPYVDTKVQCQNPECSATFSMRIEADDPNFVCPTCGKWQQAEFPCPMCHGKTVVSDRVGNAWVPLMPLEHEHAEPAAEPEPQPEPAPEPTPEPEPATEEQPTA